MDELSPLFHDIEFNERFRGYDVDEVDAYVDRVAKAAALVQGRIAELQQRVVDAEGRPPSAGAPQTAAAAAEPADEQSLARVLLLAQRTADAAIEEAKGEAEVMIAGATAEADRLRADADEHASRVMAEAETDRRRMIADAESEAAAAASGERERLATEIAELERYRSFLSDDISILESHLADARLSLAASVSALTDLIDSPQSFRAPTMPATSGVEAPAIESPEPVAEPEPVTNDLLDLDATRVAEDSADLLDDEPADPMTFDPAPMPEPSGTAEPEPTQPVEMVAAEPEPADELIDEPAPIAAEAEEFADAFASDLEPVVDEADESAVYDVEAEFAAMTTDPEPIVEPEPDMHVEPVAVDEPAADIAPDEPPTALDFGLDNEPAAEPEAGVVDLTDDPIDLVEAEAPLIDEPQPEAMSAVAPPAPEQTMEVAPPPTTMNPPRLVTAEDLENGEAWIDDLASVGPITQPTPAVDDGFLFSDPEPTANDDFLDQLRGAVSSDGPDGPDDFGEDALAAFFDDGGDDDDGGRNWFNRRR